MREIPNPPPSTDRPSADRRRLADRRARPTPLVGAPWTPRRRAAFRRAGEAANRYADRLSGISAWLAILVLLASSLDAAFTLLHLDAGARELNPIMAWVLGAGPAAFVATKTVGTGFGVIFLAFHQNFRAAWFALRGVAGAYAALLAYHGYLFLQ